MAFCHHGRRLVLDLWNSSGPGGSNTGCTCWAKHLWNWCLQVPEFGIRRFRILRHFKPKYSKFRGSSVCNYLWDNTNNVVYFLGGYLRNHINVWPLGFPRTCSLSELQSDVPSRTKPNLSLWLNWMPMNIYELWSTFGYKDNKNILFMSRLKWPTGRDLHRPRPTKPASGNRYDDTWDSPRKISHLLLQQCPNGTIWESKPWWLWWMFIPKNGKKLFIPRKYSNMYVYVYVYMYMYIYIYIFVLNGFEWFWMVLNGFEWFWMVLTQTRICYFSEWDNLPDPRKQINTWEKTA